MISYKYTYFRLYTGLKLLIHSLSEVTFLKMGTFPLVNSCFICGHIFQFPGFRDNTAVHLTHGAVRGFTSDTVSPGSLLPAAQ